MQRKIKNAHRQGKAQKQTLIFGGIIGCVFILTIVVIIWGRSDVGAINVAETIRSSNEAQLESLGEGEEYTPVPVVEKKPSNRVLKGSGKPAKAPPPAPTASSTDESATSSQETIESDVESDEEADQESVEENVEDAVTPEEAVEE